MITVIHEKLNSHVPSLDFLSTRAVPEARELGITIRMKKIWALMRFQQSVRVGSQVLPLRMSLLALPSPPAAVKFEFLLGDSMDNQC